MEPERILGLDIGDKFIGIAMSDPLGWTAQPYKTYRKGSHEADLEFFGNLIKDFNIKTIVCGLPTNIDGTESKQTVKTKNYVGFLKNALKLKDIVYMDETLTTMEADEILTLGGMKDKREKKKKIDMIAAQIILQNYLDNLGGN